MNTQVVLLKALLFSLSICLCPGQGAESTGPDKDVKQGGQPYRIEDVKWTGDISNGKGGFQITGVLLPGETTKPKLIYKSRLEVVANVDQSKIVQVCRLTLFPLTGIPEEILINLDGVGTVEKVDGEGGGLLSWSIRVSADGDKPNRQLVLALSPHSKKPSQTFEIHAVTEIGDLPKRMVPLRFHLPHSAFSEGMLTIHSEHEVDIELGESSGLISVDPKFWTAKPESPDGKDGGSLVLNMHGSPYSWSVQVDHANPDADLVAMKDFKLVGQLKDGSVGFRLTGSIEVRPENGGSLDLVSGNLALTETEHPDGVDLTFSDGRFSMQFPKAGVYPLILGFESPIVKSDPWNTVQFDLVESVFRRVVLQGFKEDSVLELNGMGLGNTFGENASVPMPSSGPFRLRWQDTQLKSEAELFFSVNGFHEIVVSPGLINQENRLDYQVMQGEMREATVRLVGKGQVTQVNAPDLLAWDLQPSTVENERLLTVKFNQSKTGSYSLIVHSQTPLEALPLTLEPMIVEPIDAIRYGGYIRINTVGAVRMEPTETVGLTQVSPEVLLEMSFNPKPRVKVIYAARFSGLGFSITMAAEEVTPEISVSQILVYHLAEAERVIDMEIELEIREAPLREWTVVIPRGYLIASVDFPNLADYQATDRPDTDSQSNWVLSFRQPLMGKHTFRARLERNIPTLEGNWSIPTISFPNAKSVRGQIGLTAEQGFRLSLIEAEGLTEVATAFFPKKLPGMQAAFRVRDIVWRLEMDISPLPLSVQVETLHLFSAGEGSLYGSSLMNYYVVGSPISSVKLALPGDYQNIEFHGQGLRGWQNSNEVWEVRFQSPVSGAFTLLANYEKKLGTGSNTLDLAGSQAIDAQSEQGYVMLVSSHPYEVQSTAQADNVIQLEQAEIPEEYRALADAPILAAFQYVSRPFSLPLSLRRMPPGETRDMLVDRAHIETRISKEGQVLSECRYFIKSNGHSHFRVRYGEGQELWSVEVAGQKVVPVKDNQGELIPLPLDSAADKSVEVKLVLAWVSDNTSKLRVDLPRVSAPVLLTQWNLTPDTGNRLDFTRGISPPQNRGMSLNTFEWFISKMKGSTGSEELLLFGLSQFLVLLALGLWKWITASANRNRAKYFSGLIVGTAGVVVAVVIWFLLLNKGGSAVSPGNPGLQLLLPVMASMEPVFVECVNKPLEAGLFPELFSQVPAWLGILVWGYALITSSGWKRRVSILAGWFMWIWAGLCMEHGTRFFLIALGGFILVHGLFPAFVSTWKHRHQFVESGSAQGAATAGLTGLIALFFLFGLGSGKAVGAVPAQDGANQARHAERVHHTIQVTKLSDSAECEAEIVWNASKDALLPILKQPGVLISLKNQPDSLTLIQTVVNGESALMARAGEKGVYEFRLKYQIPLVRSGQETGFKLPVCAGLKQSVSLSLPEGDFQVQAPEAVSIVQTGISESAGLGFNVIFPPRESPWIGWMPKQRDASLEDSVFFARWHHLFLPLEGIVESAHVLELNLTQGQVRSLTIQVPANLTVTDVFSDLLRHWRFDAVQHQLSLELSKDISTKVNLLVKAQASSGNLPYSATLSLPSLQNANNEIGFVGVASSEEIQINSVAADAWERINLDDFPSRGPWSSLETFKSAQVYRAFRFSTSEGSLTLSAGAVEPDIRIQNRVTLSLGEDRVLLASHMDLNINRTGIFKLSFPLPRDMDVESLSGNSVSHWTEFKSDTERVVSIHFPGRTGGAQSLDITLAGPGVSATNHWEVPRLLIREATRQSDMVTLFPERGFRLQVGERVGVTEINPEVASSAAKGVLAFRFLNRQSSLHLAVETVEPWVQASFLQLSRIQEGQHKVRTLFDYTIDNTGLREITIDMPGAAEGVRFTGNHIEDAIRQEPANNSDRALWRLRFTRRMAGALRFEVAYHEKLDRQLPEFTIRTLDVPDADLVRGFLNVRAIGRLGITLPSTLDGLQKFDWQSLPSTLREGRSVSEGFYTFRIPEPPQGLTLGLVRREAVKLLPAELTNAEFLTLFSESGQSLTQVDLKMSAGDKRSLLVQLPPGAQFWFGQVDGQVVQPWETGGSLHLPLDQARGEAESKIVFFYTQSNIHHRSHSMKGDLIGPSFDLPIQNVNWTVSMSKGWELTSWKGGLEMKEQPGVSHRLSFLESMNDYIEKERQRQMDQSREAEALLSQGNEFLQSGSNEKARQAFEAARNLSLHDAAFNEDARVQLQNVKKQQAVIGLNTLRNNLFNNFSVQSEQSGDQATAQQVAVPDSTVQSVLGSLAERLVQHQGSAGVFNQGMHIAPPVLGKEWVFSRSLVVDASQPLKLNIEAKRSHTGGWFMRSVLLLGVLTLMVVIYTLRRFITGPGFLEASPETN